MGTKKQKITFNVDQYNSLLKKTAEDIEQNLPDNILQRERILNEIRLYFPNGVTVSYSGDINDPDVQSTISLKIQVKLLSRLVFALVEPFITPFLIGTVAALIIIKLVKVLH